MAGGLAAAVLPIAAALPAQPAAADIIAAAARDPVLDLIAKHRTALAALGEVLHTQDQLHGKPRSKTAQKQAERAERKAGKYLADVEWEVANTVPATLLGLIAVLDYEAELATKDRFYGLFSGDYYRAFMGSVRTAIGNFTAAGTLPGIANA